MPPNDNKMSDGYRERAPVEVGVLLSFENVIAQRVAVRSIARLGLMRQEPANRSFLLNFG